MDETTPVAPQSEPVAPQQSEPVAQESPATEQVAEQASESPAEPPKKEKTAEEREIARLRRRVDNLTRRLYQGESKAPLQNAQSGDTTATEPDDEVVSLPKRQQFELIEKRARELAKTIAQQEATVEHRQSVIAKLASDLGSERFDALAVDLDDALDGLRDGQGRPKPAADAIFEADDPRALVEYLADPENAAEAKSLARMTPLQAGRAIGRIEAKIAAAKAQAKPQPSKAAPVIEPIKGGGPVTKSLLDLNGADFDRRRREQIAARGRH